jgi:hypothetical protein
MVNLEANGYKLVVAQVMSSSCQNCRKPAFLLFLRWTALKFGEQKMKKKHSTLLYCSFYTDSFMNESVSCYRQL